MAKVRPSLVLVAQLAGFVALCGVGLTFSAPERALLASSAPVSEAPALVTLQQLTEDAKVELGKSQQHTHRMQEVEEELRSFLVESESKLARESHALDRVKAFNESFAEALERYKLASSEEHLRVASEVEARKAQSLVKQKLAAQASYEAQVVALGKKLNSPVPVKLGAGDCSSVVKDGLTIMGCYSNGVIYIAEDALKRDACYSERVLVHELQHHKQAVSGLFQTDTEGEILNREELEEDAQAAELAWVC